MDLFGTKQRDHEHKLNSEFSTKEEKQKAAEYLGNLYVKRIEFANIPEEVKRAARLAVTYYVWEALGKDVDNPLWNQIKGM